MGCAFVTCPTLSLSGDLNSSSARKFLCTATILRKRVVVRLRSPQTDRRAQGVRLRAPFLSTLASRSGGARRFFDGAYCNGWRRSEGTGARRPRSLGVNARGCVSGHLGVGPTRQRRAPASPARPTVAASFRRARCGPPGADDAGQLSWRRGGKGWWRTLSTAHLGTLGTLAADGGRSAPTRGVRASLRACASEGTGARSPSDARTAPSVSSPSRRRKTSASVQSPRSRFRWSPGR